MQDKWESKDIKNYKNLSRILDTSLKEELKIKILSAYLEGFYGTMYGQPYLKDKIIKIPKNQTSIGQDGGIYYVWGHPGPDYNVYKPEDYGKTWALTKEEFIK